MKKQLLFLGIFALALTVSGQKNRALPIDFGEPRPYSGAEAAFYGLVSSVKPYSNLTSSATSCFSYAWDDEFYQFALPFTHPGVDVDSDTLFTDANGFLMAFKMTYPSAIAVWAATITDLIDRGYPNASQSPISYKYLGNSPNQGMVIEWRNAGFYEDHMAGGSAYANFQIRLWENGTFEYRFGPSSLPQALLDTLSARGELIIGHEELIIDTVNMYVNGHYVTGDPSNPTLLDSATATNLPYINTWPDSGMSYQFVPLNSWSIDEIAEIHIAAVPNPVSAELFLKAPTNEVYEFTLVDAHGRVVRNASIRNGQGVPVLDLPRGIYIATYQKEGMEPKSFRVVLE